MSTKQLMDPLKSGAITLPGSHQLTLTGIVFAGDPTAEEFAAIVRLAETIDRVDAWMGGDVVVEYVRREQLAKPGLTVMTALAEYAFMHDKQVDVVRARYGVAKHYRHADRTKELTWTHHHLLWSFGMVVHECKHWLGKAAVARWSVAQLRAEVKQAKRPALVTEPAVLGLCPDWLRDAIDHASGCLSEVDTMPIEAVGELLNEAAPLIAYVDALRARAATPTKESIAAAS